MNLRIIIFYLFLMKIPFGLLALKPTTLPLTKHDYHPEYYQFKEYFAKYETIKAKGGGYYKNGEKT